jgi:tetratricopeptide (TPR) repeat protein
MQITGDSIEMKRPSILTACLVFLLMFWNLSSVALSQAPREPKLIRDTDVAEEKENIEASTAKELNPKRAKENVNIGNFYLKQKNYAAAAQRFLEAIEYQPDLTQAYEGLIRSYEKNGEIPKAIAACKSFLDKNPDARKTSEFRNRLAKLEKASN